MITFMKKLRRSEAGLCRNCGQSVCVCRKPKGMGLPAGITRVGTSDHPHVQRVKRAGK